MAPVGALSGSGYMRSMFSPQLRSQPCWSASRTATFPMSNRLGVAFSNTGWISAPATEFISDARVIGLSFCSLGGTKKRQSEDILRAKANREDYRNRKAEEKARWH
jgi:hypothetical protein